MNWIWEYVQTGIDLVLAGGLAGTWWGIRKYGREGNKKLDELVEAYDAAISLLEAEAERKDAHTKAFEVLSDPDKILEDMEKSADATEMRIARRRLRPREDAGPPAKIYRPKIRRVYPRRWPK